MTINLTNEDLKYLKNLKILDLDFSDEKKLVENIKFCLSGLNSILTLQQEKEDNIDEK